MALVGKNSEKNNQNLMQLIRRVHGLVENPDLEKHRQSQDHIGELLGNSKEIQYRPVDIEGMDAEWVSVNRAHMKKYVILHCHGGGYSTGSSIYARTLTSKLASGTSMDVLCFDYRLAPEHPYPAATEDAMKAWNYLMLLGYGARDVIVTGDSAGGNLALSLVLKLKEQERLLPRGIVLMSPLDGSHRRRQDVPDQGGSGSCTGQRIHRPHDESLCSRQRPDGSLYFSAVWRFPRIPARLHSGWRE